MVDAYFKQYFWTFHLAVLGAIAFILARSVNAYIDGSVRPSAEALIEAPLDSADLKLPSAFPLKDLLDRNIFHAAREDLTFEKEAAKHGTSGAKAVFDENDCARSQLQATLLATVVAKDSEDSVAVFGDPKGDQQIAHKVGDTLVEGAQVVVISWRNVLVNHDGRCELFSLEENTTAPVKAGGSEVVAPMVSDPGNELGSSIRKVSASEYEIKKAEIDSLLGNLNALANQARIMPAAKGFKIIAMQPGSFYAKIGLENNDTIERVNGYEMNSPEAALQIYSKLKDASAVTVDLVRNGKTQTLSYQIR